MSIAYTITRVANGYTVTRETPEEETPEVHVFEDNQQVDGLFVALDWLRKRLLEAR